MAIKGKDFTISIEQDNGVFKEICYSTDCIINQSFENREITIPKLNDDSGQWRDYIGGFSSYDISVPGAIVWESEMNFVQLEALAQGRTRFHWQASDSDNGGVVHSGTILITALNLTSQLRDIVRFELTAVGCGKKITQLLPRSVKVYLSDFFGVILPGCPNPYPVTLYWYDETVIGIASNADEVISQFNDYPDNQFYQLTGQAEDGCHFNMLVAWNSPVIPTYIIAEPTPNLGMWTGEDDEGISNDQDNDNLISPNYA